MTITLEMLEYAWQRISKLAESLHITIGYEDAKTSDPMRACEKAVGLEAYAHIPDPIQRVEAVIVTEYVPAYEKRAASEGANVPSTPLLRG